MDKPAVRTAYRSDYNVDGEHRRKKAKWLLITAAYAITVAGLAVGALLLGIYILAAANASGEELHATRSIMKGVLVVLFGGPILVFVGGVKLWKVLEARYSPDA